MKTNKIYEILESHSDCLVDICVRGSEAFEGHIFNLDSEVVTLSATDAGIIYLKVSEIYAVVVVLESTEEEE